MKNQLKNVVVIHDKGKSYAEFTRTGSEKTFQIKPYNASWIRLMEVLNGRGNQYKITNTLIITTYEKRGKNVN